MNRNQIKKRKKEIEQRFEEEMKAFLAETRTEEMTPFIAFRIRVHFSNYKLRLHRAILYEIAGEIIQPYCPAHAKKIQEFIRYRTELFKSGVVENNWPKLRDFFEWYCDSDVIRDEVKASNSKPYKSNTHDSLPNVEDNGMQMFYQRKFN
jgi:hypothetical protein